MTQPLKKLAAFLIATCHGANHLFDLLHLEAVHLGRLDAVMGSGPRAPR